MPGLQNHDILQNLHLEEYTSILQIAPSFSYYCVEQTRVLWVTDTLLDGQISNIVAKSI